MFRFGVGVVGIFSWGSVGWGSAVVCLCRGWGVPLSTGLNLFLDDLKK